MTDVYIVIKKYFRFLFTLFLIIPVISTCTKRLQPNIKEIIPAGLSAEEQLIQLIKQNGEGINKYYILDDKGCPIIKADITHEGINYEVTYFLEDAELFSDSAYIIRFFLLEKDNETENIIEDTLIWKPFIGSAGLLISMDDDFFEAWENNFDMFDKYEARITFFIQGMYTPFMEKAINRGHDIGYHSLNHKDLRRMSYRNLLIEVIEPAENIRKNNIPLLSFAFPFGFSDSQSREILFEHFYILRGYGTTLRIYKENEINSGYIISRAIDNIVIPDEDNYDRLINLMLRTVKFLGDGWILPLTTHDISDTSWGITLQRLEFLLQTAKDLGLRFYCYSDFVN